MRQCGTNNKERRSDISDNFTFQVFRKKLSDGSNNNEDGCYEIVTAENENLCALECFYKLECVAFYFKKAASSNCLLIKFTDATFKADKENEFPMKYTSQNP